MKVIGPPLHDSKPSAAHLRLIPHSTRSAALVKPDPDVVHGDCIGETINHFAATGIESVGVAGHDSETTGAGVRAFIVCQQLGTVDGAYEISYTNQAGTSGRVVTGTVRAGAQASQLLTSALTTGAAHNPWIPLASGDNGIRQIDSITWTTPPGGLAAIVLAKPIASIIQPETTTYTEKTFHPRMPRIHNEACLMMLRAAGNSPSAGRSYFSQITTIKS